MKPIKEKLLRELFGPLTLQFNRCYGGLFEITIRWNSPPLKSVCSAWPQKNQPIDAGISPIDASSNENHWCSISNTIAFCRIWQEYNPDIEFKTIARPILNFWQNLKPKFVFEGFQINNYRPKCKLTRVVYHSFDVYDLIYVIHSHMAVNLPSYPAIPIFIFSVTVSQNFTMFMF